MLSHCHARLGDSDQQELDLRRALVVDPHSEAACLGLGNVLLANGKHVKAFEAFRAASGSPQARLRAAQALILHNLSLPLAHRRWDEVERFVDSVAQGTADAAEAALLRTDVLAGKNQLAPATDALAAALAKSPEKTALWQAQAALLQRQDKWQEASALLDEAEKKLGQRVNLYLARARFWAERGGSEAPAALHTLEKHLDKYQGMDWQRLTLGLAEAWGQLDQNKEAASLYARLAEKDRNDLSVRVALFDLALPANQDEQVQRMLAEMRRIEGADGTYWRLGEVFRLLHQARQAKQKPAGEVPQLLKAVAERRPKWSRLILAQAEWEELSGRPENAIGKFQQAIDAGERDPMVLRRAVVLLYERRRYVEAEELLQKLRQSASPLLSGLERMSAELALFQKDGGRALQLARKAVPADSKDYRELLWLGHILSAADQWKDAEAVLRRAVELNEQVPETWLALVQCLAHMDRKPEAEALLESARVKLSADKALLTLAQGHEILSRLARAGELYEAARAARPQDATVLRNLARFLFRSGRLIDAAPPLRTILELSSKSPEDEAWARRHLAFILVATGDYRKRREALSVLGIGDEAQLRELAANSTGDDQRVLAIVLSCQPNRPQRRLAITILEPLVRKESRAADRFLLAQLYQNVGDNRSAGEQVLSLLAEQPDEPAYLSFYIQILLAGKRLDEVEPFLKRYEKAQPRALGPLRLRTRLLHARGKAEQAVPLLRAFAAAKPDELRSVAELFDELGQPVAAEETYRRLIRRKERPQDVLLLATFLGRQRRVAEGLELCGAAWKTCPPDAVATASVTVLVAGQASADRCRQVAAKLEEVRGTLPQNTDILRALAMVRRLEGRIPESIEVYHELVRRDPKDAQALNNLAWLVAMGAGKGEEGLALIQNAIAVAGPRPAFLDTRAMIHLALGQTTPAIRDLEDVVAEQPSAHRQFHLAQAYYKAGQRDVATASWKRAVAAGLQQANVDPFEMAVYQKLTHDLAHGD